MSTIHLETPINASPERCFDLSISVDAHTRSQAAARERPIAGVLSGEMRLGDTVTWEAVHFGVRQHLTSQITEYDRPARFTDELVAGIFQQLHHNHVFVPQPYGTLMLDDFTFRAPLGVLGRLAETLFLTRYMTRLLLTRNRYLRQLAESGVDPS
ncbi:MAG: SRPBCC family protein [Chloroflexota bacterium]|nr:SRPBCC family protein [Chloroflexota bacterium]